LKRRPALLDDMRDERSKSGSVKNHVSTWTRDPTFNTRAAFAAARYGLISLGEGQRYRRNKPESSP
jgi:hypothetical protein